MDNAKFKTMRHIETVRNFLNLCVSELLDRAEQHDQSKLESPEVEIFEIYTPKLRSVTYGSGKYKQYLKEMQVALDHHYENNRHHPEYHFRKNHQGYTGMMGLHDMNLFDVLEMLIDWKAATLRHNDGDILKSIQLNQERFGYGDEVKEILTNTIKFIDKKKIFHKAEES